MNPQALAKSSLLRILLPLALVLGAVFFTVRQAHALLDRALQAAFGEHDREFRSVWFDWSGDVIAKQVVLRPNDVGKAAEVRFERVWLETPGWTFFLRNVFDRSMQRATLSRVHLVLGDATVVDGLHLLVPELGPVGAVSGAVFESDGCGRGTSFTRERLTAMGMSPGPTSLEIDHRVAGDAMQTLIALATPGSSRTQLERTGKLDAPRASLLGERAAPRIEFERWSVGDQGFVAARNRFCAAQDGVTPREALERHVAAVDRRLQQAGLSVDENAHAFYRRFARSGGEMSFGGEYKPPLSAEESLDSRDDGRALARMNAVLERDRRAVPIVWRTVPVPEPAVPVAPAPELPAATPAVATPAVPIPTPEPVAPPVTARVEPPSPPVVVAPPVAQPVEPPPVVVNPPEPAPKAPEPAAPESEPATPEPATTPPVAAPARPKPTGTRIERIQPTPPRPTLAFDDLANYRGRQVRLWTVHNPPRTVQVLDAAGDEVRVRVKLVGGQAEYTVKRAGFLRATLVR